MQHGLPQSIKLGVPSQLLACRPSSVKKNHVLPDANGRQVAYFYDAFKGNIESHYLVGVRPAHALVELMCCLGMRKASIRQGHMQACRRPIDDC